MARAGDRRPETDERGRRADAAKRAQRLAREQRNAMPVVAPVGGPRATRTVDAPLVEPAPKGGILEVIARPYLLRLIVQRTIAGMYANSLLGLLWSYIQPAMRFAVFYFVLGMVLNARGIPYYAIHLFVGMIVVHYFSETWSGGTRSIWQNRDLLMKMRMPREIFPVAQMLVAGYHTLPQVLVLLVCCVVVGWHLSWAGFAAAVLGVAILVVFSMAMGLFFSAVNVFAQDFQNIVNTILQFMHFLVPMIYPFALIFNKTYQAHRWAYELFMANPLTEATLLLQRFFWWDLIPGHSRHGYQLLPPPGAVSPRTGQPPLPTQHFPTDLMLRGFIALGASLLLLWLAQVYFSRVENKFAEIL